MNTMTLLGIIHSVKIPFQQQETPCKKSSTLQKVHPLEHNATGPLGPKDPQYYTSQLHLLF